LDLLGEIGNRQPRLPRSRRAVSLGDLHVFGDLGRRHLPRACSISRNATAVSTHDAIVAAKPVTS